MSQLHIYECDQCRKRIDNFYWHEGWINFTNVKEIYIRQTLGYDEENKYHKNKSILMPNDFCSKKCFCDWVIGNFQE